MKKKMTAGFTLVELIVVIAILGILAGIGTVGYSGYIKKANMAADQQLVSGVKNALELAKYADPKTFPSAGYVMLSMDSAPDYNGNAQIGTALQNAFGSDLSGLKLKYKGWGNGVAVTQAMLSTLTSTDGNLADMNAYLAANVYGDSENLSFTEQMPELMQEIRNIADEFAGENSDDAAVISMMNAAAAITSGFTVNEIQNLWGNSIAYDPVTNQYTTTAFDANASGKSATEKKAAVAAVVRARNTCMALAAIEAHPELAPYYSVLTEFSDDSAPVDLYTVSGNTALITQLTDAMVAANPEANASDIQNHLTTMETFLGDYGATDATTGKNVSQNDAAAFYTMMQTIKSIDEGNNVNETNLDEYFNSVTGSVDMFQTMVQGNTTLEDLNTSISGATATDNTIVLTIVGNKVLVSPTGVLQN